MRQREFIDKRQFDQLSSSFRHAEAISKPLNTFVTIQFGATACEAEQVGPAFRRLIKDRYTPWLRPSRAYPRDERPAAWIYWLENVHEHDHHPHGTHVHWLLNVQSVRRTEFDRHLKTWLISVAGMIHDPDTVIRVQNIDNLMGLRKYIGKGLKPADAKRRGVRPIKQGAILGRRLSISNAINASAIARHQDSLRAATKIRRMNLVPPPLPSDPESAQSEAPWD